MNPSSVLANLPDYSYTPDNTILEGFYPIIGPDGNFVKIREIDVILLSMLTILATPKGSRVWAPDFGCNLLLYLFEPSTSNVIATMQSEVTAALEYWENRVSYKSIDIEEVQAYSEEQGYSVVKVRIRFKYKNRDYTAAFIMPNDVDLLTGPVLNLSRVLET